MLHSRAKFRQPLFETGFWVVSRLYDYTQYYKMLTLIFKEKIKRVELYTSRALKFEFGAKQCRYQCLDFKEDMKIE